MERVARLQLGSSAVSLAASPDACVLAAGLSSGAVGLHDSRAGGGAVLATPPASGGEEVGAVAFAPDGTALLFAQGASVRALDLRAGGGAPGGAGGGVATELFQCGDDVGGLAFHPKGGALFAAASDDGTVVVAEWPGGRGKGDPLQAHSGSLCSAVAFRPHRPAELVSVGLDGVAVHWDFERRRKLRTVSLAENGAATGDGLQVVNPPLPHALSIPASTTNAAAPGAHRLAAVACQDGAVVLLDLDHGNKPRKPKGKGGGGGGGGAKAGPLAGAAALSLDSDAGGHTGAAACVEFATFGDGDLLVSGGTDRRLLLWSWTGAAAGHGALRAQVEHKRKVNWLCTAGSGPEARIAVADTSPAVSVYALRE